MALKLKYGFRDRDNWYIYICDTLNIKEVAKRIMKYEEALEYEVDSEISNDGKDYFNIIYKSSNCTWDCHKTIYISYLVEIQGSIFELPKWGLTDSAEIIKPKKAKTKG